MIFLFIRATYFSKNNNSFELNSDINILNINLNKESEQSLDQTINKLKPYFKYLKLKSANVNGDIQSYVFWYDMDEKKLMNS